MWTEWTKKQVQIFIYKKNKILKIFFSFIINTFYFKKKILKKIYSFIVHLVHFFIFLLVLNKKKVDYNVDCNKIEIKYKTILNIDNIKFLLGRLKVDYNVDCNKKIQY